MKLGAQPSKQHTQHPEVLEQHKRDQATDDPRGQS